MAGSWWRGLKECGPLEERMANKPLQYSCFENPVNSMKRKNDRILKENYPGGYVRNILQISGEITPERMKGRNKEKTMPNCGFDW